MRGGSSFKYLKVDYLIQLIRSPDFQTITAEYQFSKRIVINYDHVTLTKIFTFPTNQGLALPTATSKMKKNRFFN